MTDLLKRRMSDQRIMGIAIALFLGAVTFVLIVRSPISIWNNSEILTDSSVFEYIAFGMQQGEMPYRDMFDHKGPLLYVINYIGMLIQYYKGVWYIEFIAVYLTCFFVYKTARLNCNRLACLGTVIICATLLYNYYVAGNLSEEYAMPFIGIALYIFLDYFLNRNISKIRLMVCGFTAGGVCMLRPNMTALWIVFSLAVILECVQKKKLRDLSFFILYFCIGFFVLVLPLLIWLVVNNSFTQFIDCYIDFNMIYSTGNGGKEVMLRRWEAVLFFLREPVTVIAFIISGFLCTTKRRFLDWTYIIFLLVTMVLIILSGQQFGHYGMILMPSVSYSISYAMGWFEKKKRSLISAAFLALLGVIVIPVWMALMRQFVGIYEHRGKSTISNEVAMVCQLIKDRTDEDDRIAVYGNWNIIYILSHRLSVSRYSFSSPKALLPSIEVEYFEELRMKKPSFIVIQNGRMDEIMEAFLEEYKYQKIWFLDGIAIYEKGDSNA